MTKGDPIPSESTEGRSPRHAAALARTPQVDPKGRPHSTRSQRIANSDRKVTKGLAIRYDRQTRRLVSRYLRYLLWVTTAVRRCLRHRPWFLSRLRRSFSLAVASVATAVVASDPLTGRVCLWHRYLAMQLDYLTRVARPSATFCRGARLFLPLATC